MNWEAPVQLETCCVHLRHKMMYVDPRQATPGRVDGRSDTRIFLCHRTQEVLGPDGATVSPKSCGAGRNCCQMPVSPVTPTIDRSPLQA